jgi:hypothetical protein
MDCGVALPHMTWLCSHLAIFRVCWICSVMDLTLPHQSVPTLGRPTPRLPSNENRSAPPGPSASLHVLASVLPTQFGSINEYTGWK